MPAHIVVVHDDPAFIQRVVTALRAVGYDVAAFMNTMRAIEALEAAQHIEVLITRVVFPMGQPNGVALARMARVRQAGVKVLFTALQETQEHTVGAGEFLPAPVATSDIVEMVGKMLSEPDR
jgi:DNA-binding NtrC family response regulator